MYTAFFLPDGEGFVATPLTRGPWDDRFQHGGPPSALLVRALEGFDGAEAYTLARLSVTFLGAVPLGPVTVRAEPVHLGRATQRLKATLEAGGRPVLVAEGLRIRRGDAVDATAPGPADLVDPWPAPEALDAFAFPFFRTEVGYHRAVELCIAKGRWGRTPVGFWARPVVPLVEGEPTSPRQATVILADAQSGMGPPVDPFRFTYVNPDLHVAFARTPEPGWIGLDIRSFAGPEGTALSHSLLRDALGAFGGCMQSMVVAARPD